MAARSSTTPPTRRFVLVALLGVLLTLVIVWQTGVPLQPRSLHLAWFVAGLAISAATSLVLYRTRLGARVRTFLAETNAGQLLVLLVGLLVLVVFSGIHQYPYTAELASAILGASLGSLAPLVGG